MNFIDKIMQKFGYIRANKIIEMLQAISKTGKVQRYSEKNETKAKPKRKPTVPKATTRKPAAKKTTQKK